MWYSSLIEMDVWLFHHINAGWSNSGFDMILPIMRSKYFWLPVYTFIIAYLYFNHRNTGWKFLILILLGLAISDSISSQLIKKNFQRLRPCQNVEVMVVQRIECGSGYSFTSSHAANHFFISVILVLGFIKRKWLKLCVIVWAITVSIAQVYVGLHYPLDVIGGALLGSIIGVLLFVPARKMGWTIT